MRTYALVVLNNQDKIIDRYNLDITTQPTGNGFELEMSTISSDLEDIITKVVQKKNKIIFTVQQINESYQKANILAGWIQKYSTKDYIMALEYNDGNLIRYCEGRVTKLEKGEQIYRNVLQQRLEFTQTTPFFIRRENTITIKVSSVGKKYDFKYPYSYGASKVENNEIYNPYILDVPLILSITGAIYEPTIDLVDEDGNRYNRVYFRGETLAEGETIYINSAQRKVFKIDSSGRETDYSNIVSPEFDTFLRAGSGISKINIPNISQASQSFSVTGSWRQYTL